MTVAPIQTFEPLAARTPVGPGRPVPALAPDPARGRIAVRACPEAARSYYLAEAVDAHDLARRVAAWDGAQAGGRAQSARAGGSALAGSA